MIYIFSFLIPVIFILIFEPYILGIAESFHIYDRPNSRKIHTRLIPLWGGVGIWLSVWAALAVVYIFSGAVRKLAFENLSAIKGIFLGSAIILVTGMADDKRGVTPTVKLLAQLVAVLVVLIYGVQISGIKIPFLHYVKLTRFTSIIITAFWLLAFTNIINLIDGIDGLASGISGIAALTFSIVVLIESNFGLLQDGKFFAIFSLLIAGACFGFLYFNFPPAGVFLGDSGSLLLGFFLGIVAIQGMLKLTATIALIIPVIVVALPVIDVFFAIIRRKKAQVPIMKPDSDHIHHRLLKSGWTPREIDLLLYNLTLLLAIAAIIITVFSLK
ncbi:MAG: undecaprenyl-phosphate alpha-N-acetylglucosaminyl 1-phosphate transferase [Elusimicrobia bacterium CG08_land_8_20_14_0_20_44_26]|nr:MAG: undecaprenyl-phosphate alpha-N-acetylglucosaminyl 1-phosphate transferase [Elusimicrobia bacterium CG08_land_8_20_14_0_20_44_26]